VENHAHTNILCLELSLHSDFVEGKSHSAFAHFAEKSKQVKERNVDKIIMKHSKIGPKSTRNLSFFLPYLW
jgi:hypothetical protein